MSFVITFTNPDGSTAVTTPGPQLAGETLQQWQARILATLPASATNPQIVDPSTLAVPVPPRQAAAAALQQAIAAGLAITSTSTPALNATYPLDPETLFEITAVEAGIAGGQGLPLGAATVTFVDISGNPVSFTPAQFTAWAAAIRNYFAALKQWARALAAGQQVAAPAATAAIP
jgi:hypothetical protein